MRSLSKAFKTASRTNPIRMVSWQILVGRLLNFIKKRDDDDDANFRLVLPDDLLNEAIPGNIRKAEHFVAFLRRFVEYLKVRVDATQNRRILRPRQTRMRVLHVVAETPLSFLQHLKDITYIERRPLRLVFM